MSERVTKWQTWGLIAAYKVMLTDPATCADCRKLMWEQARMWGIAEEVLDRIFGAEIEQMIEEL